MMPSIHQVIELLGLSYEIVAGKLTDPAQIGRRLASLALDFVPVEELKDHLSQEAKRRVEAATDAYSAAKFGPR